MRIFSLTGRVALIASLCLVLTPQPAFSDAPKGWHISGDRPRDYEVAVDANVFYGQKAAVRLRSVSPTIDGFGALIQKVRAEKYRGRRVRLSAYVKSDSLQQWAGLWMRIDGPGGVLSIDNMHDRPIVGTRDWTRYEVVLNVPEYADAIAFGDLVIGTGTVWMADVSLEIAPDSATATAAPVAHEAPTNLDFSAK
jgi:hypothetical protein